MGESPLASAMRRFEATEANLEKLERLWTEISGLIPRGIQFGPNAEYEDRCRSFRDLISALPRIDGWKPEKLPLDLDEIAQWRMDVRELGEPIAELTIERSFEAPAEELREYRFRFNQKRRALIRDELINLMDAVDAHIRALQSQVARLKPHEKIAGGDWDSLKKNLDQIDALLGSSVPRPNRWQDLRRHVHFGMVGDFLDIEKHDWPAVKQGLGHDLYGRNEPLPVDVADLGELVAANPKGGITTELAWSNLTAAEFERLMFALISTTPGYENPEWLMHTNAPDRGRDLSVTHVASDPLSGVRRRRVIIQCKHQPKTGVSVTDIAILKENMKAWGEPRVDVLIIATTGRFTADAVAAIEKHNVSDSSLWIEMWPESHLERLLAARPALIAEFGLR